MQKRERRKQNNMINVIPLLKKLAFPVIAVLIIFGTHFSLLDYAALALFAVLILVFDEGYGFYLLVFFLNMANIFKPGPSSTSFFTYVILLYVAKLIFLKKQIPPLVLLFALYIFATQFVNQNLDLLKSIKLIFYILMVHYVINSKRSFDTERVLGLYVAGVIMASLTAFLDSDFFRISALSKTKVLGMSYGYGVVYRFSGLDTDPNYYSVALIISLCIVVLFYHKKKIKPWLAIALFACLLTFVVLTYSKSALIMTALPVVCLFYGNQKLRRHGSQFFLVVIVTVFLMYVISGKADFLEIVMARFTSKGSDLNALTTGRSSTWAEYINYLRGNIPAFLFGSGVDVSHVTSHIAHNTYIEILFSVGLLGGTLFLASLRTAHEKSGAKKNLLNCCIGVCMFIMYFFLSEMYYYDSVFHLILAKIVFDMDLSFSSNKNASEVRQFNSRDYVFPLKSKLRGAVE